MAIKLENVINTHTLTNGAVVCSLSPHGFKFSDGTESGPQDQELVKQFTLERKFQKVTEIKGMILNEVRMVLSDLQLKELAVIASKVDIVIVPFPMLTALREQGIRASFPNCVAFNATPETQRSAPHEKVVDISNWSY